MSGGSKSGPSKRPPKPGDDGGTAQGNGGAGSGAGGAGPGSDEQAAPPGDPCDLIIELDLSGVRTAALSGIAVGEILDVVISRSGGFEAAVVRSRRGAIVGSLASVEKIDRLLRCLRDGVAYEGEVTEVERTRCRAVIRRAGR